MKYLIMIYLNPEARALWESFPESERAAGLTFHEELKAELAASGELVRSEALVDWSQAKRVLVHEGRTQTTDGPFAEVKEFLAGFYLVDCVSLDRAVEIAARMPESGLGTVEVRQVMESLADFR
ncbi:MAG TPA: YciI family protein [Actinophytocola sp.]|uniref:YciI family protein n=1 Tax=Actinophytocola sp. TaxID=1872138 RepID=UPI002DF78A7F|nr:YciI family protein [Actinophytocola sp.]